ncbi:MAG: DUF2207 domain-containing protein [Acidobacteriota bacterium]
MVAGRLTVLGVLALLATGTVFAKSYHVARVDVNGTVEANAALLVEETLTYRFKGRFRFAYRDIPTSDEVSVSDVRVSEAGSAFMEQEGERPGTFTVRLTDEGKRITWYYTARNETRTFRLTYTLTGAVHRYTDVAEVNFKLIGDGWDRAIGQVHAVIHLPDGVPAADIRAWAHGPLYGTVAPPGDSLVEMSVSPLPARTYFEGRVLFPAAALSAATVTGATDRLDIILAEERRWAEEANALRARGRQQRLERNRIARQRADLAAWLAWPAALVGLAGLLIWLRLWRHHGRPYPVSRTSVPGEIPSAHPPAVVGSALLDCGTGSMLAATLLDLARRGHFVIEEGEESVRRFFGGERREKTYTFKDTGKPAGGLLPFEADLRTFVLTEVGNGNRFAMADLKALARSSRSRFRRWLMAWKASVADHAQTLGLREPLPAQAMAINLVSGFLVAVAGGLMLLFTFSPLALLAIVPGVLQMLLTISLQRLTPEGRRLQLAWRAYSGHLKEISRGLPPPDLTMAGWESIVLFAVLFGLHDKVLPLLRVPSEGSAMVYPVWYHGVAGGSPGDALAGLSHGISSMASAVASTASSAAGTGGGAGVGGGAGAGGGGGGAG